MQEVATQERSDDFVYCIKQGVLGTEFYGAELKSVESTISRTLLERCRDAIGTTNLEGEDELLADLDRELEQKHG